jgi:hypothetical protein
MSSRGVLVALVLLSLGQFTIAQAPPSKADVRTRAEGDVPHMAHFGFAKIL